MRRCCALSRTAARLNPALLVGTLQEHYDWLLGGAVQGQQCRQRARGESGPCHAAHAAVCSA